MFTLAVLAAIVGFMIEVTAIVIELSTRSLQADPAHRRSRHREIPWILIGVLCWIASGVLMALEVSQ